MQDTLTIRSHVPPIVSRLVIRWLTSFTRQESNLPLYSSGYARPWKANSLKLFLVLNDTKCDELDYLSILLLWLGIRGWYRAPLRWPPSNTAVWVQATELPPFNYIFTFIVTPTFRSCSLTILAHSYILIITWRYHPLLRSISPNPSKISLRYDFCKAHRIPSQVYSIYKSGFGTLYIIFRFVVQPGLKGLAFPINGSTNPPLVLFHELPNELFYELSISPASFLVAFTSDQYWSGVKGDPFERIAARLHT